MMEAHTLNALDVVAGEKIFISEKAMAVLASRVGAACAPQG
jgi:hypothetical protein